MSDFNAKIIDQFRANDGKVDGFDAFEMLLLHTTGAKTGAERVNPLAFRREGADLVVFGSVAGAPKHPAWYHNLVTTPAVTVELGTETYAATARVAKGDERTRIWEAQKAEVPQFADYEQKTDREIPVIVLERA
jgi:deazaflavin-dependent oxidoreductase (nitroreductase family)